MAKQKRLHELFDYKDGELIWKIRTSNRIEVGDVAGTTRKNGYKIIRVDGRGYLAHRLIFEYMHGYLPPILDHIDGNPSNNRIENLRSATVAQNQYNRKLNKNSSSGLKGVCFYKTTQKWMAYIRIDRKFINLGYYTDKLEAARVANEARRERHGEFVRLT
jgi:hypothetical protein